MDAPPPQRSLVVSALTKQYRTVRAIDDVSIEFGPGVNGLLGPNGAGKTTLLRVMATAEEPTQGMIQVLGHDTALERAQVRRLVGYAPQEGGLYPSWGVRRYLEYIALLRELADTDERRAAVHRALRVADLTSQADMRIRELSGGMRRRLLIAQAMLAEPEVLLLDEPFAGLDPEQRVRMRSLIAELGRSRVVVVSTHQTEDVSYFCDHVVVLNAGKSLFAGAPTELVEAADGCVWVGPPTDESVLSSALSHDQSRHLGVPPDGRPVAIPTIEDGYLLVLARSQHSGHVASSG